MREQRTGRCCVPVWDPTCDSRLCCAGAAHQPRSGGVVRLDRRIRRTSPRGFGPARSRSSHHMDLDRVSAGGAGGGGSRRRRERRAVSLGALSATFGPGILLAAGISLIDDVGDEIFTLLHEGDHVTLDGGKILDAPRTRRRLRDAGHQRGARGAAGLRRGGLADQIEAFANNTMELPPGREGAAARRCPACRTWPPRSRAGTC